MKLKKRQQSGMMIVINEYYSNMGRVGREMFSEDE